MTLGFKQTIGRTEPLRTGTYAKTLTFTLKHYRALARRAPGASWAPTFNAAI